MIESTTVQSNFKLHPHMLYQAIMRQAGSLEKAVLEGVMNLVDAKATKGDIVLTREHLTIEDNGQGFRSQKEINEWFEQFGMPQDPDSDKMYGQFRMGRGQMFAFGVNHWRSGKFQMSGIDIKNRGLGYDLTTHGTNSKGCKVEVRLYKNLSESELLRIKRAVEKLVKYMPSFGVVLTLNGKPIGVDARSESWTFETADAWVRLTDGTTLDVYNLGAFVNGRYVRDEGRGGIVVSKKQLEVNFARNDLMSSCPVWGEIRKEIHKRAGTVKKRMTDAEREFFAERMLSEDIESKEALDAKIFTDVAGRHWSAKQLYGRWGGAAAKFNGTLTHAAKGDRRGDKVHQQKIAFVMATETLERFGSTTLTPILRMIKKYGSHHFNPEDHGWTIVKFSEVANGMSSKYDLLDPKELTANETLWLRIIGSEEFYIRMAAGGEFNVSSKWSSGRNNAVSERRICVGVSDCADAWTDGTSFIAFSREFLRSLQINGEGIGDAFDVLLHEYCHDGPDGDSHEHNLEFYQTFHDARRSSIKAAYQAWRNLSTMMEGMGRTMTRREASLNDRLERIGIAKENFEKIAASVSIREEVIKGAKGPKRKSKAEGTPPTPPTPPTTPPPPEVGKNPYGGKYGIMFRLGSQKFWKKADLLAAVAAETGQTEKQAGMALNVLGNEKQGSNKYRSRRIINEVGEIRLEAI